MASPTGFCGSGAEATPYLRACSGGRYFSRLGGSDISSGIGFSNALNWSCWWSGKLANSPNDLRLVPPYADDEGREGSDAGEGGGEAGEK